MTVKTRIAPSPTGRFHIGTARTALVNYLFAHHEGGSFVTRIEDTDKERSKVEHEAEILEGMTWLGFTSDELVRQSERAARHRILLQKLIDEGKAEISNELARPETFDKERKDLESVMKLRTSVIRLKNPPGRIVTFHDEVRGDITFDTTELGDFVIAKSLDEPLYHFAVVVDDWDMAITHVIRGEDHISNTPRQILIQEALGAPRPVYAHLPLILNEKRAKMSKRSGDAVAVMDYRDAGFLSEALVNYIALVGWSPGDDREDFSLVELVEAFSLSGVQKGGASWNKDKLLSVNQRWMRKLTDADYLAHLSAHQSVNVRCSQNEDMLAKAVPLMKERAHTFAEARELLEGELSCLFGRPALDREKLLAKEPADRPGTAKTGLESALKAVQGLQNGVSADAVKETIMPIAEAEEAKGKGGRGAGPLGPCDMPFPGPNARLTHSH